MTALFSLADFTDTHDVLWSVGGRAEANPLLTEHHYLGPLTVGGHALIVMGEKHGRVVAAQVWRRPTSRRLPCDGSWIELSRWCLTSDAGKNAGSRMHKYAVRLIRKALPEVTTLVSYSDPSQGHTGALYRACNWTWAPTWHRLRTPPSGNGMWRPGITQSVKDRWVFAVSPDSARRAALHIDDAAAIRYWRESATESELRWATTNPQLSDAS